MYAPCHFLFVFALLSGFIRFNAGGPSICRPGSHQLSADGDRCSIDTSNGTLQSDIEANTIIVLYRELDKTLWCSEV